VARARIAEERRPLICPAEVVFLDDQVEIPTEPREAVPAVRRPGARHVMGHGGETEEVETYRGTTVKVALHEKVRLEIGVSEPFVDITVRAILESARTGDVGDGKVFVLPVEAVHRIRTGDRDEAAVTPAAV